TPAAAAAVTRLGRDELLALEAGRDVSLPEPQGQPWTFRPEDVRVDREVATDWVVQSQGALVVALDPALTDALRLEGLARELVNRVQRLRKEAGYDYTARIALSVSGARDVVAAARRHERFITGETLAREFTAGQDLSGPDVMEELDIDGRQVRIAVRRHQVDAA
ncbi:MAG TPA: DUF5915 domain-containing protein, partial [Gemmatimonadales bacterium]|nr:DUF5915 domain-containing protein [Gemmatimonadales bacterium]